MTPLRQRMVDDMKLRGLSANTRDAYLVAIRQLAKRYQRSPDRNNEEELRAHFLYLKDVRNLARSTITVAICAIKFLYERTLGYEWPVFDIIRPPRERKLPVVLGRDEVRRTLRCVRVPDYRACLTTIYSCGLRLSEATRLEISDVDSSRMQLHVHGKAARSATFRCPRAPWRSSASTGKPIALRAGSSRHASHAEGNRRPTTSNSRSTVARSGGPSTKR